MSFFKSAFTVGSCTLISRIAGYVRDMVTASFLGATPLADAFFVAFRLPNIFRQLSAEGAFNSAFVPLFSGKLSKDGKEQAVIFAGNVLSFMFMALLIITVIMEIFMPLVIDIFAPGFGKNKEQFDMAVYFARLSFPYLIFISLVSLIGGMLNCVGKFAVSASAPILLNLCLIASLFLLTPFTETPAHALSWGVSISGVVQLLWLMFAAYRADILPSLSKPRINDSVKTLLKRMVPGIIGGGVTQINILVSTLIATMIPSAVSYLYYSDRLVQFPLAIVGTAMGTALLPLLSKQIKEEKFAEAIISQNKALVAAMFFAVPAAVALYVMADIIVQVTFEHGKFGHAESLATATAVMAYSVGLPAFVMVKIFAPVFFASGDTKTPVKIAIISMVVNIILSIVLMQYLAHVGLALATSTASWVNTILLVVILHKRGLYNIEKIMLKKIMSIIISSVLMGGVLYIMQEKLGDLFAENSLGHILHKLLFLVILIAVGKLVFFGATFIFKVYDYKLHASKFYNKVFRK